MKKSISFWAIVVLIVVCGWYGKNLKRWDANQIIDSDVIYYYAYLPATFIYHDWTFEFKGNLPDDFEGRIWTIKTPEGQKIMKMTMGLSMLWLPFEAIAHLYAELSHFRADGYTKPYSVAIFIAALFYLFIGLFFLRKVLLKYFDEAATTATIVFAVLATNIMHYVIAEPGMSHVYNFCLVSILLYLCIKWYEKPVVKYSILLGIVAGLIVLIRPVNIVVLLVFLLWGVNSFKAFKERILLLIEKKWMVLVAIGFAFLIILPQLIYWKIATGHWFCYSYGEEGFFFFHPHIIDGLFSYRKGWFIYTPIMILATGGFIFIHKYIKGVTFALSTTMVIAVYIIYSWWCWWYGGSYGSRPMIDFYGIMALPLAALIQYVLKSKIWLKTITSILFVFFIFLNQFQMNQYRKSLLHFNSMTKEAYWGIFLKTGWPKDYDKMIKKPDQKKALIGEKEYP